MHTPTDQPAVPLYWSAELKSVIVYVFLLEQVDLDAVRASLESIGLWAASKPESLSVMMVDETETARLAARLRISQHEEAKRWDVEINVRLDPGIPAPPVRIAAALESIASAIPALRDEQAFSSMDFVFDRESWIPALPLPMSLPIVRDQGGGTPEIHGFEFAYTDIAFPIRRANIALSDEHINVTLLVRHDVEPPATLIARLSSRAQEYLPLMVQRLPTSESADA